MTLTPSTARLMAEAPRGGRGAGAAHMTPREGVACRWCGYPVTAEDQWICDTCCEWNEAVGNTNAAIGYAQRESDKERQQKWESRK